MIPISGRIERVYGGYNAAVWSGKCGWKIGEFVLRLVWIVKEVVWVE